MALAKEGLERSTPFESSSEGGDGLTLTGHAAVFNTPTRIDSWEGTFDEQISSGAFKKTIRERTPVMQFDHGRHPLIGSLPIGKINSLSEDDTGLAVEGRMTDNWLMQPVRDAIADGTVSGMSFRFDVIRDEWTDNTGKILRDPNEIVEIMWQPDHERGPLMRTLKELRVHELGPVVFPAYPSTDVGLRMAREMNTETRKAIQVGLARSLSNYAKPVDDTLSDEIARALLWGGRPTEGHRSEPEIKFIKHSITLEVPEGHPLTEKSSWVLEDMLRMAKNLVVETPKSLIDPQKIAEELERRKTEDAPVTEDHPSKVSVLNSDEMRRMIERATRTVNTFG